MNAEGWLWRTSWVTARSEQRSTSASSRRGLTSNRHGEVDNPFTPTTLWPADKKYRHRLAPMNPVAPVITTCPFCSDLLCPFNSSPHHSFQRRIRLYISSVFA